MLELKGIFMHYLTSTELICRILMQPHMLPYALFSTIHHGHRQRLSTLFMLNTLMWQKYLTINCQAFSLITYFSYYFKCSTFT